MTTPTPPSANEMPTADPPRLRPPASTPLPLPLPPPTTPLLLLPPPPLPPPPTRPKKPPLTHFLSLPLHHSPLLAPALDLFKADLAEKFPELRIPPHALRPAECIHLTLGVMSLRGKVEGEEEEGKEAEGGGEEGQKRRRGGRGGWRGRGRRGGWRRERGERAEGKKVEREEGDKDEDTAMGNTAEGARTMEREKRENGEDTNMDNAAEGAGEEEEQKRTRGTRGGWKTKRERAEGKNGENTAMETTAEAVPKMVDEATDTAMETTAEGPPKMVDEATDTATDKAAEKAAEKAAREAAEAEALAEATRVLEGLDLRQILREAGEAVEREREAEEQEGGVNISQEAGGANTMPEDTNTELEGGVSIVDTVIPSQDTVAPLRISLQGLSTMGSAHKSSVLYITPIDGTSRLQRFAEAVRQRFVDAGLVVKENRDLKLHATVLNTVYARHGGRRGKGRPTMLDFRGVLDLWKERVFVEDLVVDRVAVCLMGAKERDGVKGAGGYEEVAMKAIFTDD